MEVTQQRAHRAWRRAEHVRRLSDDLVSIGPWGIGLDGVLAWVPGANLVYSVGAGGLLLYEAVVAGASGPTLLRMGLYLTVNSAMTEVPILGWAMDTLFRGHLMAARALQKDIEKRFVAAEMESAWRQRGARPETVRVVQPDGTAAGRSR